MLGLVPHKEGQTSILACRLLSNIMKILTLLIVVSPLRFFDTNYEFKKYLTKQLANVRMLMNF